MKKALGLWLLALGLLAPPLHGQTACVADQWCKVFDNSWGANGLPMYKQNAWNKAVFSHDTGFIYQKGQANQTSDGTLCNKANPTLPCSNQLLYTTMNGPYSSDEFFTSVSIAAGQPTLYTNPPYVESYSSAMTEDPVMPGQYGARLWLAVDPSPFPGYNANLEHRPLQAGDSKITLCARNSTCTGAPQITAMPDSGFIALDDEVFKFSSCVAYGADQVTPLANCGRGSPATAYSYALTVATDCGVGANQLCRGQRTGANWTAASTHYVNDTNHPSEGWAWLATPKILNSDGTVRYGARINTYSYCNPGHTGQAGTPSPNCVKPTDSGTKVNFLYERPGGSPRDPAYAYDGPTSRHQRGIISYDGRRGKLWNFMGFQEQTSNIGDLWWRCIYVPASGPSGSGTFSDACTAADLEKGWQHANLSAGGSAPNCIPGSGNCYTESDTIYLPLPFDALVHFGGLLSGGHSDLNIMCLSATSVPVKACHSDGDINNAASYVPRWFFRLADSTAFQGVYGSQVNGFATCNTTSNPNCHGNPGFRDGPSLAYDPLNEKMLIVGGKTSVSNCGPTLGAVCWTSVAHWNPRTSDYCMSDTSQDGLVRGGSTFREFNGAGCNTTNSALKQSPLPNTGAAPFTESTSLYFAAATWNNNPSINKLMLVKADEASATTSGIFLYDPTSNTWSRSGVVGGPPPHDAGAAIAQGGLTLIHDDNNSMNWLVEAHVSGSQNIGIWELADSALTGQPPVNYYNLTVYLAGTGSGAVLDSPQTYINCGSQCGHTYTEGSTVTLTAQPSGGSTFAGWAGACTGTGDCTITMDADKNVTATFNPPPVAGATTYSGMKIQGVKVQ
jgi:hypothetical protein